MTEKKKILYVITQGHWGGAQRYIFDFALHFADKFEIYVAVGEKQGPKDLQEKISHHNDGAHKYNINLVQLEHLVRHVSPYHDILALIELKKLYKEIEPDIVHLNSSKAGILGSFAKLILFKQGPKIVYTAHGWVFNEPIGKVKKWLYKFLEKHSAKLKDKIIILSEKDYLDTINILKIKSNKIHVTQLAIEPPQNMLGSEPARFKLLGHLNNTVKPNSIIVGTIANLYSTKGIDVLVRGIAQRREALPRDVQFVIIGDGPEKDNIHNLIAKNNLDDLIQLVGFIPNAFELLPAMDMFVLPSRKEGLPYTILEAVNYMIPVVATDVGSIGSIIEHKTSGLLCQSENPDELIETIIYGLENKHELEYFTARALEKINNNHASFLLATSNLYLRLEQHP